MSNSQSQWLDGYLLRAVQPLPIFTLRTLGFKLRVGLNNDLFSYRSTDYRIEAAVYSPEGKLIAEHKDLGLVKVGQRKIIDTEQFLSKEETKNQLIYFSLIPLDDEKESKDGIHFRANRGKLRSVIAEQSHQIEFYRDDGYSSAILVSPSPFNYMKFANNKPSTFIQGPKIFSSNDIETYLTLTNSSPERDYNLTHEVSIALSNGAGKTVAAWNEVIPPFQMKLINLKQKLLEAGEDFSTSSVKVYCATGICETGVLYPMFFTRGTRVNALAFEHTFPPGIYAEAAWGPLRTVLNKKVRESKLFKASIL